MPLATAVAPMDGCCCDGTDPPIPPATCCASCCDFTPGALRVNLSGIQRHTDGCQGLGCTPLPVASNGTDINGEYIVPQLAGGPTCYYWLVTDKEIGRVPADGNPVVCTTPSTSTGGVPLYLAIEVTLVHDGQSSVKLYGVRPDSGILWGPDQIFVSGRVVNPPTNQCTALWRVNSCVRGPAPWNPPAGCDSPGITSFCVLFAYGGSATVAPINLKECAPCPPPPPPPPPPPGPCPTDCTACSDTKTVTISGTGTTLDGAYVVTKVLPPDGCGYNFTNPVTTTIINLSCSETAGVGTWLVTAVNSLVLGGTGCEVDGTKTATGSCPETGAYTTTIDTCSGTSTVSVS